MVVHQVHFLERITLRLVEESDLHSIGYRSTANHQVSIIPGPSWLMEIIDFFHGCHRRGKLNRQALSEMPLKERPDQSFQMLHSFSIAIIQPSKVLPTGMFFLRHIIGYTREST